MAVVDVVTYNGERDILKMRFKILAPYVDRFIIVEAKTTFTGKKKQLYFSEHENSFKQWWPKIRYHIIKEKYTTEEWAKAAISPNTAGASHWINEFLQKESIHKALKENHVQDNDVVYIGDADEIWNPLYLHKRKLEKLKLRVYAYYIDNLSSEEFWGTLVGQYKYMKGKCLNELRSDVSLYNDEYAGWHFTSMGGVDEVRRKLNASYTNESYNTPIVQDLLKDRVKEGVDYLGRPFTFTHNMVYWPEYLKRNRSQYLHLCKPI